MTKKEISKGKDLAIEIAKIAEERHCTDVVVLDLKKTSPATDYFVVATGTSGQQIRSTAEEIAKVAKKAGHPLFGRAGYEQGKWVLLDFVNVVVHLFDEEYRDYYDLEMLWGDAKKIIFNS